MLTEENQEYERILVSMPKEKVAALDKEKGTMKHGSIRSTNQDQEVCIDTRNTRKFLRLTFASYHTYLTSLQRQQQLL